MEFCTDFIKIMACKWISMLLLLNILVCSEDGDSTKGDGWQVNSTPEHEVRTFLNTMVDLSGNAKFLEDIDAGGVFNESRVSLGTDRFNDEVKRQVMDRFIAYSDKLGSIASGIADIIIRLPGVSDDFNECCVGSNRMKLDEHLSIMVDKQHPCIYIPSYLKKIKKRIFPASSIGKLIRRAVIRINNSLVSRTMFTMKNGMTIMYPMMSGESCRLNEDMRTRVNYRLSSTTTKRIVVIFDQVVSVNVHAWKQKFRNTKRMTSHLLNIGHVLDKVSIIPISYNDINISDTFRYSHCGKINPQIQHIRNTAHNRKQMIRFIDKIPLMDLYHGNIKYNEAINKACDIFRRQAKIDKKNNQLNTKNIIVLAMNHGLYITKKNINDSVYYCDDLDYTIVTLTNGVSYYNNEFMKKLDKKKSILKIHDKDGSALNFIFENYVNYFANFDSEKLSISHSYIPITSTSEMIGLSKSVVSLNVSDENNMIYNMFQGVLSFDIKTKDIDRLISRSVHTNHFMMDSVMDSVVYHPNMPMPLSIGGHELEMDVCMLENFLCYPKYSTLYRMIKTQDEGFKNVNVSRWFGGRTDYDYPMQVYINSTLHWNRLPDTNYVIVTLVKYDVEVDDLSFKDNYGDCKYMEFTYNNFQQDDDVEKCRYFDRVATLRSSVMFSHRSFISPTKFMKEKEVNEVVATYRDFIMNNRDSESNLKPVVRNTMCLTSPITNFWKNNERSFIVWRVISMANSLLRIHPGIAVSKYYDATDRSWFMLPTLRTKDIIMLRIEIDGSGGGHVITVAKSASTEIDVQGKANELSFAITQIDVKPNYVMNILKQNKECIEKRCFLIDDGGFVIIDESFTYAERELNSVPKHIDVHITNLEPDVANDLIQHGAMKKVTCISLNNMLERVMYVMEKNSVIDNSRKQARELGYRLSHVVNSNVFLVVVDRQAFQRHRDSFPPACQCKFESSPLPPPCVNQSKVNRKICECPCFIRRQYDQCHPPVGDPHWTICLSSKVMMKDNIFHFLQRKKELVELLDDCFDDNCADRKSDRECNKCSRCTWCVRRRDGSLFNPAQCRTYRECIFSIEGHSSIYDRNIVYIERRKFNYISLISSTLLFGFLWIPFSLKFEIYNNIFKFLKAEELNQKNSLNSTDQKIMHKKMRQKEEWRKVNTRNKLKRKTIIKNGLLKEVILTDDEGWKKIIWKGYMEHVTSSPIFRNDSLEWMRMSELQVKNPNDRWNMGHRNRYIEKKRELYELMKLQ